MINSRKPVNYATMLPPTTQVALFGEMRHYISEYKLEMLDILPLLKNLGFTHFCLEMLPYSMQPKLDAYSKTEQYSADIIQFL